MKNSMWSIIWNTVSVKKTALFSYTFASIIFAWMFVALFPSFQEESVNFEALFEAYPQEFLQAFNVGNLNIGSLENFVAFEYLSLLWPFLAIFLVVSFAGNFITKEIERGTIEILLSRPISRIKLYFSKLIGAIISLSLFTAASFLAIPLLAELYNVSYKIDHYLISMLISFFFGLAFLCVAFMISSFFSERNRAYMVLGGIVSVMYFAKILTNFQESLENLKYISFFHYLDSDKILVKGEIDMNTVWVFFGVGVITTTVGVYYFNKRDIAV